MTEWNPPFIKGFSTCFTICSVIAGVAIYFNNTIVSLKDENIERLEKKIAQQKDYSEKYHKEQATRRQVEIRETDLKEQLKIQITKKWEEKYLSEHLANQSLKEQIVLLETRNNNLHNSLKIDKPDPKKDLEIKYLKEELNLTKNELEKLRALYTEEKEKTKNIDYVHHGNSSEDETVFKMVKDSIPNLGSSDTEAFLVSTYKGSKNKITISQLSEVVQAMGSSDLRDTIKEISENIVNDGNPETLKTLIEVMGSSDSKVALIYLIKNKN